MEINPGAEKQRINQFLIEDVTKARKKYAGKIFTDKEVVNLITNGDLGNVDTIVQWLGSDIPPSERPISRFAEIFKKNFDELKEDQKETFLLNGIKLAIIDFQTRITYNSGEVFVNFGEDISSAIRQKNVGKVLDCALKFTNNSLEAAKKILARLTFNTFHARINASHLSYAFYRPQSDAITTSERNLESREKAQKILKDLNQSNLSKRNQMRLTRLDETKETKERSTEISKIQEEYLTKNPKIKLLAFWLDAYSGRRNPNSSSFDDLLEDVYPKSNTDLKTQIMIFVKENLLSRKVHDMKYYMIENIIRKELSEATKTNHLDSFLAKECNEIKSILEIDRMIEKTKGGKIKIEDLVNLLEGSPHLIGYITDKELQTALDTTLNNSFKGAKDYNLINRINKLITDKQTQKEKTL